MLRFKRFFLLVIFLVPTISLADTPKIIINEIAWMGTETSSNDEWLELYNSTDAEIDLAGWRLEATDGSPIIALEGIIAPGSFFILERSDDDTLLTVTANQIYTGSLGNTGEYLKLFDPDNNVIDELNATEGWPGGDNTSKQTLERVDQSSWHTSVAVGGTPNASNSAAENEPPTDDKEPPVEEAEPPTNPPSSGVSAKKGDIIITEVLTNPRGSDLTNEFIEIKNVSTYWIDITSWLIITDSKQTYTLPSIGMSPNSIVTISRQQSGLALNNNKEIIKLKRGNSIIDQVDIRNQSDEGFAYARDESGHWQWTDALTPGEDNNLPNPGHAPVAVIYGPSSGLINEIIDFDAADSFSPINEPLSYWWDFGNQQTDQRPTPRTAYLQAGSYEVSLTVSSPTASSTESVKIKISGPKSELPAKNSTGPTSSPPIADPTIPFVFISEFLPDPEGADGEGEFIELFNHENFPVDLSGWQLDDTEGGSRPYTLPAGTIIKPGQYLAFFRPETKISLNNSDDQARLITAGGVIVDLAEYENTDSGVSFVLDEQFVWRQSETPTPGEINVLNEMAAPTPTTTATTTPAVLGAASETIIEPAPDQPDKTKYFVSGLSALAVIGLIGGIKIKGKLQSKIDTLKN